MLDRDCVYTITLPSLYANNPCFCSIFEIVKTSSGVIRCFLSRAFNIMWFSVPQPVIVMPDF